MSSDPPARADCLLDREVAGEARRTASLAWEASKWLKTD